MDGRVRAGAVRFTELHRHGCHRFRDSMEQVRVPRAELAERLRKEIKEYKRIK